MTPPLLMQLRMPAALHAGVGALAHLGEVLREMGAQRPLLVTDGGVAASGAPERALALLTADGYSPRCFDGVEPEPDRTHVERCRDAISAGAHDILIAIGGGSVIDVAKAAAALDANGGHLEQRYGLNRMQHPGLAIVAVPTAAGSGAEVSSHAVIVEPTTRKKEVVSGPPLLPRAVIVDPALTLTLSPSQTLICALDGLIHALEAFVARRATPATDLFTRAAIPMLLQALPEVLAQPQEVSAREQLSLGCLYAGIGMANANAGVIHALGYPLTTGYGIAHGLANGLMAPAAVAQTLRGAPQRYAELGQMFAAAQERPTPEYAAAALPGLLRDFLTRVGVQFGLSRYGVKEADLPDLAARATHFVPVLDNTPYRVNEEELHAIYRAAWA